MQGAGIVTRSASFRVGIRPIQWRGSVPCYSHGVDSMTEGFRGPLQRRFALDPKDDPAHGPKSYSSDANGAARNGAFRSRTPGCLQTWNHFPRCLYLVPTPPLRRPLMSFPADTPSCPMQREDAEDEVPDEGGASGSL